jgi:hypothetical protein
MRASNPTEPMILVTQRKTFLQRIIQTNGVFTGQIMTKRSGIILKNVTVTVTNTVVSRPLNSQWRQKEYPSTFMPFYLYGSGMCALLTALPHTHILLSSPT